MNKIQFRNNLVDPSTKFLSFQPRNYSRQYNKSKSNKKSHINKNILSPCEPLSDKLLKAALQKNQRKIVNNRREKTQQSLMQTSMSMEGSRCFNHADKKGEYFLQAYPNKKFCLKCNLSLNNGNNSSFITKEKHYKKIILDKFKQQIQCTKEQLSQSNNVLHTSIQLSQQTFSSHSSYINQSFTKVKQQLDQKRRQLINNLIIAQQNLKKQYEQNLKKIKKVGKNLERYQLDIKKFYDQIIQELPKIQFDQIMEEYQQKLEKNIKKKLQSLLINDGICVYIPNVELSKMIEKANLEFYQPVSNFNEKSKILNKTLCQKEEMTEDENKRMGSNSLDSKINEIFLNLGLHKKQSNLKIPQKKKQVDLELFQKKTGNFKVSNIQLTENNQQKYMQEDKQNFNTTNISDFSKLNCKGIDMNKFTFKQTPFNFN